MTYFAWVVYLLLFLVMVIFAGRNLDIVHVHGFLGYEWQTNLVVALLASLVAGVVLGVAGAVRTMLFLGARSRTAPPPADLDQVMGPPAPAATPIGPLRGPRDLSDLDEGA